MEAAVVDGEWRVPPQFNFARDVVDRLATDRGRKAMLFLDRDGSRRELTFAEVAAGSCRWANVLRQHGLRRGDRLVVLLGKRPEWHEAMLGCIRAGGVSIPGSDQLRARDIAFRVRHSGARLVVAERVVERELTAMVELLDDPPVVRYLDELAAPLADSSESADAEPTAAEDPAFLLYTSGTTKDPKGVVHTHGYCFAKRMQAQTWLDARPDDLVWCTAGTGWAKSIWNVLLGPWSCGAQIVLDEGPFDAAGRFELVADLRPTVLCQAPTEFRLMAKLDGIERYDLSGLRHAVSAGEPLNPEVIKSFRDAFGLTLYDGYGQTENSLLAANLPGSEIRPGSMGLPTPGHRLAVVDEDGRELPPGEEGDIALAGRPPTLFSGYYGQPEETAAVYRGDWYVSGDRAVRDEDGYLWFTGRADDVILSAAYRIGPFEVESALLEHPAASSCAGSRRSAPRRRPQAAVPGPCRRRASRRARSGS